MRKVPEDVYYALSDERQSEALFLNRLLQHCTDEESIQVIAAFMAGKTAYGALAEGTDGLRGIRYHTIHEETILSLP